MSTSSTSEGSSFTKFFNDDMKNEFLKVKDMVQILIEDQRESVKLHAQLMAMKDEKEIILQRLHDMEKQLLQAQEALSKKMHEDEVNHSNLSSISSIGKCVGSFEKHTRGMGSKLMFKMGYQEGKGLGKHAQGMVEPISVVERPKNVGLGYEQFNGEEFNSLNACNANLKRTFIPSSQMNICQNYFKNGFHCFKPSLQQVEGKHVAYGEHANLNNFQDKHSDESLKRKVVSSTSSSSLEDKKDGHSMQKTRKFCCAFCGGFNHVASRCWLKKKAHMKQMRQRKLSQKVLESCKFCQKKGHHVSHCWTLHPTSRPKHMQLEDKNIGTSGSMDSIIDVEDSHEELWLQQKSPLKWLGKKWMNFLIQ